MGERLPTGTLTFLFTDVEGSTRLWESAPDAMRGAIATHDRLLADAVERLGGRMPVAQGEGDSIMAVFPSAQAALRCALDAQLRLHAEAWPPGASIRVRAALHTGEAELRDGNYYGEALNRTARIRALAHGGQTLVSRTVAELAGAFQDDASLRSLGPQRLRDISRPEEVFQLCHPELPDDFPPLSTPDSPPNNLPAQLTTFVGREDETRELGELLAEARLATVTGAGGCGKTRIALRVADDLLDRFPDGVWFAALAAVTDEAQVAAAVADAVRVREDRGRPLLDVLGDALRPRRLLLVLDNCEHVLIASGVLADTLLRGCPDVRILATSREPLGIPGEIAWRLPSLTCPAPGRAAPPGTAADYDAVRLFAERAKAVRTGFAVGPDNAEAVVNICARLDGIPLAIELAAARAGALTPQQIADRLDDRFRLLTGGARTLMSRQRTLRALVDWSHDLLDEPEKVFLRRLAVFAGSFTLEASEAVCSDEPIARDDVLDLLDRLVAKSLVATESGIESRYRLSETIRDYALEKLLASGDGPSTRTRHLEWYTEQAAEYERESDQGRWLEAFGTDRDNVRSALEWSSQTAPPVGLRLAASVAPAWAERGHLNEGRRWLEQLIPAVQDRSEGRAGALRALSMLAWRQWDLGPARVCSEEALSISREIGDPTGEARSLVFLATLTVAEGRFRDAVSAFEACLELTRDVPNLYERALVNLANTLQALGEYPRALSLLHETLALDRERGNRRGELYVFLNLGSVASLQGDFEAARMYLEEALSAARESGGRLQILSILEELAGLLCRRGDHEAADGRLHEMLSSAGALAREGEEDALGAAHHATARSALFRADWAAARASAARALEILRRSWDQDTRIMCTAILAKAAHREGDEAAAKASLEEACSVRSGVPDAQTRNWSALAIADAALVLGDHDLAATMTEESVAGGRAADQPYLLVEGLRTTAAVARRVGEPVRAAEAAQEALSVAHRFGHRPQIVGCLEMLAAISSEAGDGSRAGRLYGAAGALRERMGLVLAPSEVSEHEADLARARSEASDFDEVWAAGRAMTLEDTVRLALDEYSPVATLVESTSHDGMFRREGEYWTLEFDGRRVRLKDAKGLRDIAALVGAPGKEFHVYDLIRPGAVRVPAAADTTGLRSTGGVEPVLDAQSRDAYKRRLTELAEEREEAEEAGDLIRASRAQEEADFITSELAAAYGLGGRQRRMADPAERARKAVQGRIKLSLSKIAAVHPSLARHLEHSLRTGVFCSYEPEQPVRWRP